MSTPSSLSSLQRLLAIMARLRDPETGCEWDRAQSFATIAPYTIEEAYEVADAIAKNDLAALRDELGDLLLQVVFHARIAEEAGAFTFADVASAIADKMERRHPHIFKAPCASADQADIFTHNRETRWEEIKANERLAKGTRGILDGVAHALPALLRAEKLQKRAARAGFDWPDPSGPAAKLAEEAGELASAENDEARFEEAGDLLFSAANLVRAYNIAPEEALRAANTKFERRFAAMEALAREEGKDFCTLSLDEQETWWNRVKLHEFPLSTKR